MTEEHDRERARRQFFNYTIKKIVVKNIKQNETKRKQKHKRKRVCVCCRDKGNENTYDIQWTRCGFVVYIVDWHTSGIDVTVWIAHLFRFEFL